MQTVSLISQSKTISYPLRLTTLSGILLVVGILYLLLLSISHLSNLVAVEYSVSSYLLGRTRVTATPVKSEHNVNTSERIGRVLIPSSVLQTSSN